MADPFEYDVFISFSSADEEIVKPIWQELCSNGLRVFWSDSTLKKEVGNSWFEVIEKSLERSKHMLLVCSNNSMDSKWVKREYRAFFDYCYSPSSRRLIPLLTREFPPKNLPIFLRELQVGRISDSNFIQEIIPILGGVNIERLQQELKSLQEQAYLLSIEKESINKTLKIESKKVNDLLGERKSLTEQLARLKEQNDLLSKTLKKQEKTLLLNGVNIEKLQQERLALQEQINLLSTANQSLGETAKEKTDTFNALMKENNSTKAQLAELKKHNFLLVEVANKNISLNEQTDISNNDIKFSSEETPVVKLENTGKSEIKKLPVIEVSETVSSNSVEEARPFVVSNSVSPLPPTSFGNLNFVIIPSGWYVVYNKDNESRERNISYDYWIGKTPITNEQFFYYAKANDIPFAIPEGKGEHPVVQISWFEANQYIDWLNLSRATELPENCVYALPSIEEWEKAAKGNKAYLYPWGNNFNKDYCNTEESGNDDTTPVEYYSPHGDSFYGVSDMIGNVEQWTRSSVKDNPNLVIAVGSSYYSNQGSILKEPFNKYNPNKKPYTCGIRLVVVPSSALSKKKIAK